MLSISLWYYGHSNGRSNIDWKIRGKFLGVKAVRPHTASQKSFPCEVFLHSTAYRQAKGEILLTLDANYWLEVSFPNSFYKKKLLG